MPHPVILVCSVEIELDPLLPFIRERMPFGRTRRPAWTGTIGGQAIVALAAGMGKTNAAHSLTAVLEHSPAQAIIGFGVGGAYPGSGLSIGDVAVAKVEVYGDEGVLTPSGWISCETIGIPLVESAECRLFNEFESDAALVHETKAAFARRGIPPRVGPFVTVSTCSGTEARGRELAERFGAICETMEGAAYAHIAALYGLPFVEIRGISNVVEDRYREGWKLREASIAAVEGVAHVVTDWRSGAAPLEDGEGGAR